MVAQQDIDEAVLTHIARYRLTTPRILTASGALGKNTLGEADATLEALSKRGLLRKAQLAPEAPHLGHCYSLTARAAKRLGHDPEFASPLKRDSRIDAYAIATFCCCTGVFRELFTRQEFIERFSALWYPGQPLRYCLEPAKPRGSRLAFLKVDKDGPGRWDRLIDSCMRFVRQRTNPRFAANEHRSKVDAFAELLKRGQFQITVLTAVKEKVRAIELELARRHAAGEPTPLIKAHVVPGLLQLMHPTLSA